MFLPLFCLPSETLGGGPLSPFAHDRVRLGVAAGKEVKAVARVWFSRLPSLKKDRERVVGPCSCAPVALWRCFPLLLPPFSFIVCLFTPERAPRLSPPG